ESQRRCGAKAATAESVLTDVKRGHFLVDGHLKQGFCEAAVALGDHGRYLVGALRRLLGAIHVYRPVFQPSGADELFVKVLDRNEHKGKTPETLYHRVRI